MLEGKESISITGESKIEGKTVVSLIAFNTRVFEKQKQVLGGIK